jgi:hypothetical protein
LANAVAHVTEQVNKAFLFVHLSVVVGGPFLSASHFDRPSNGLATIHSSLFLNSELYSVHVLTWLLPFLKVWASAEWVAVVKAYDVSPIARLGRYFPAYGRLYYLAVLGYNQSSFFSRIHLDSLLNSLLQAYNTILSMGLSIPHYINIFLKPIDFTVLSMVYLFQMDDSQTLIASLKAKGWGNKTIAEAIGVTVNAVEKWQAGGRNISPSHVILLNQLTKKKPPKRRRNVKGGHAEVNK